jgi:6-phosphogluconolactonase/glucosamine-6-phosphate isomerase/deaminase
MSITLKTTSRPEDPAEFIVLSILNQLKMGKRVLFFVTGGSSIAVGVRVAEYLRNRPLQNFTKNLTIMLTDERYGPLDHPDSNWYQLIQKGFSLAGATLIPTLIGEESSATVEKFNITLGREMKKANYKIGLFGVGTDGHTAGILPGSGAVEAQALAYGYKTESFERITITPKVIEKLNEAVIWAQGEDKWKIIESLQKEEIEIIKQPAQILKKIPLLTIFYGK